MKIMSAPAEAQNVTIGELSLLTGVNRETIRYYEKIRLLPSPPRTRSGRRLYGAPERRVLSFIRRARELGFTLEEIRALLKLGGPERGPCADVREIASRHLADIKTKRADLLRLERVLSQTISKCAKGRAPRCPILEVLDQDSSP